jgi:hypothetical protein
MAAENDPIEEQKQKSNMEGWGNQDPSDQKLIQDVIDDAKSDPAATMNRTNQSGTNKPLIARIELPPQDMLDPGDQTSIAERSVAGSSAAVSKKGGKKKGKKGKRGDNTSMLSKKSRFSGQQSPGFDDMSPTAEELAKIGEEVEELERLREEAERLEKERTQKERLEREEKERQEKQNMEEELEQMKAEEDLTKASLLVEERLKMEEMEANRSRLEQMANLRGAAQEELDRILVEKD